MLRGHAHDTSELRIGDRQQRLKPDYSSLGSNLQKSKSSIHW